MKRFAIPVLAALAMAAPALGLAACGEKSESGGDVSRDELKVALDFFPNADHAGIYRAREDRFFDEAGLRVDLSTPPSDDLGLPLKQAAGGQADLAITYEPEVLLARDKGIDVVAVAALVQRPLTSLMWRADNRKVNRVADLEGRRVATAGIAYQDKFLDTAAEHSGIDPKSVRRVNVGFNLVKPLVSGRVDATLGGFWNVEGEQLRLRGEKAVVKPVDQLGIPTYDELVFVASPKTLKRKRESIELFLAALQRGTRAAARDAAGTARILRKANRDLDAKLTRASLHATLPVLNQRGGRPYGYLDPQAWQRFGDWMLDNELIDQPADTPKAISNDLLPRGPR